MGSGETEFSFVLYITFMYIKSTTGCTFLSLSHFTPQSELSIIFHLDVGFVFGVVSDSDSEY